VVEDTAEEKKIEKIGYFLGRTTTGDCLSKKIVGLSNGVKVKCSS